MRRYTRIILRSGCIAHGEECPTLSSCLLSLLLFFSHSPRPSPSSSFRPLLLFLDRPLVNHLGSPSPRANFSFRIKLHTVYARSCPLFTLVFLRSLSPVPLADFPLRNYHYSTRVRRMQCRKRAAATRLGDRSNGNFVY